MERKTAHKINIHIGSTQHRIYLQPNETLLEALIGSEIFLKSNCGGKGRCGKCKVQVANVPRDTVTSLDEQESKLLGAADIKAGFRLACRMKVSGNMTATILVKLTVNVQG